MYLLLFPLPLRKGSSYTHAHTRARFRVANDFSDQFSVDVGVHKGSVLSPLLFIIVLDVLYSANLPWKIC